MDCQQQVEASNNIIAFPPVTIHVMVVDDDAISLAVLSNLLKALNYQVGLFTDPICALYTLRAGKQSFDLIVTALYMSKMDGFELTKRVNDEFKLPVIMISTDNRESVMYRAIQEGVVLYLVKPFSQNDLTNIWQFAIPTKSRSEPNPSLIIEETRSDGRVESQAFETHSVSASNEVISERKIKKSSKGNQEKANGKKEVNSTKKKAKVVWTDFLQYRFLQAVHFIGLDRAVPKKILEVMNVPSLTRENVASHLQKYRIFLRKVSERCMITPNKTAEEMLWSKFLSQHASFLLQKIQQKTNSNLNSSQNPNSIPPFPIHQSSLNPNIGDRQSKPKPSSFEAYLSPYYGLGHPASFITNFAGCPLSMMNQNYNAQAFNFPGAQFPNLDLPEDHSYLGCSSFSTNNGYDGFPVGIGGGISMAQMGIPSNGFDGNGQFGPYGIGFGGDHNSYNSGFMCNNNDVKLGGDSQITVRHSSHALDNKQPISGGFMKDQSPQFNYNMSTADEVIPTTDPFSIDEQVLNEFMASLLKNDGPAQG